MKWTLSSAPPGPSTTFLAARAAALRAIRGDDDLIVEGRDLRALRPAAQAYAEAYRELLAWQLRQAERGDETQRATAARRTLPRCSPIDTVEAVGRAARTAPGGPSCWPRPPTRCGCCG